MSPLVACPNDPLCAKLLLTIACPQLSNRQGKVIRPSALKFWLPPMHGGPPSPCCTWISTPQALLRTIRLCITVSLRAPLSDRPTPSGVEPACPTSGTLG